VRRPSRSLLTPPGSGLSLSISVFAAHIAISFFFNEFFALSVRSGFAETV
jgi:hypothetical protein